MAFIVFLISALTDFLDGASARLLKQKTRLGALLDPFGDKIFMTAAFIVLTVPSLSSPHVLPVWLTVLVIGRDLLIVGGALFLFLRIKRQYFPPTMSGKTSTVCHFFVLLLVLYFNMLGQEAAFMTWLYLLCALMTVISGTEYVMVGRAWYRSARSSESG
jgi:cardiolipin synthase